jgi:phosphatidylcholine synthase
MIILFLGIMVFVPIKYIYPSQPQYVSRYRWVRIAIVVGAILWGVATAMLMLVYPQTNVLLMGYCIAYTVFYAIFSMYRTLSPVKMD